MPCGFNTIVVCLTPPLQAAVWRQSLDTLGAAVAEEAWAVFLDVIELMKPPPPAATSRKFGQYIFTFQAAADVLKYFQLLHPTRPRAVPLDAQLRLFRELLASWRASRAAGAPASYAAPSTVTWRSKCEELRVCVPEMGALLATAPPQLPQSPQPQPQLAGPGDAGQLSSAATQGADNSAQLAAAAGVHRALTHWRTITSVPLEAQLTPEARRVASAVFRANSPCRFFGELANGVLASRAAALYA